MARCPAARISSLVGLVAVGVALPVGSVAHAGPVRTAAAGSPIVGEAPLPNGSGVWIAYADGAVTALGQAQSYGDASSLDLSAPIRAIAATADGKGYWLLGSDGGIFSFGDARFFGSTGGLRLNQPIVGMAPTADDGGYWLVASDGGIFSFGDARFYGSTGDLHLNQPIVGMAPAPAGNGYWLVAADGGIFTFGAATFAGSTGSMHLASPVVGMAATSNGGGYWLVASDGGVFTFGDANFAGSAVGAMGGASAVGIIPNGGGYWVPTTSGAVVPLGTSAPAAAEQPGQSSPASGSPLTDPSASLQPSTAFADACYNEVDSTSCDTVALAAIDVARAAEGLGALALPAGFDGMGAVDQLVAVTNAERTSRGLPAFAGPDPQLDGLAQSGASANTDPTGPGGVSWVSNWAGGVATPLAADYLWMYDDGEGSGNIDCTATVTSGCWGHRHNILANMAGSMGAASVDTGSWTSMTELMAS